MSNQDKLFKAIKNNKDKKVEKILKANPKLINTKYENGKTPLHLAAAEGRLGVAIALVNEIKKEYHDARSSLIHFAAMAGHKDVSKDIKDIKDITELLTEVSHSIYAMDNNGKTPLDYATENNHTKIVELLSKELAATSLTDPDIENIEKKQKTRQGI